MLPFKSSGKHYTLVQYGLMLMIGILLVMNYLKSSTSVIDATCQPRQEALYHADGHRRTMETTIIAHAPGFTLFENAYWKNYTWYFISSRPWAFPELTMVVTNVPDYDELPEMYHNDGLARVVPPTDVENLGLDLDDVEVVEGSTVSADDAHKTTLTSLTNGCPVQFFFNDKICQYRTTTYPPRVLIAHLFPVLHLAQISVIVG
jgi:hypothetical protein